jgi:hypothetical protein
LTGVVRRRKKMDEHDLGNMICNIEEAINTKGEVNFSNKAAQETLGYLKTFKELIEKEKPMKPIVEKTRPVVDATCYGYGYKDDICPHCHKLLNRWSLEWNRDKYDYCPHCGQRLDWEEAKNEETD